jgi:hypothetical protein
MSWSNLFYMMSWHPQLQAALIGPAWIKAQESGDMALISNLLCNTLHPTGLCQALDFAGVPVPPEALPIAKTRPSSDEHRKPRAPGVAL